MHNDKSIDAFTYHILERIDPKIKKSLSAKQYSAIQQAISAGKPKDHSVDIRGEIPLFFSRFYFIFIMGKENRSYRKDVVHERRKYATFFGNLIFTFLMISPLILITLIFWYFLISLPGIYNSVDQMILKLLR